MMGVSERGQGADRTNWRSLAFKFAAGGVTGFLAALGLGKLMDSGALGTLDTSREIAALVGLIYLVTAGVVVFGLASPRAGAKLLNVEDAAEINEMRPMLWWSAVGTLALAAILFLAAFAAPGGALDRQVALLGIILLVVVSGYATVRQKAHVDELMRAVSLEATVVAYYLLVLVGGGWALAAHLDFTGGPQPLDWLSMMAAFLLLGAFIVATRRGMIRRG